MSDLIPVVLPWLSIQLASLGVLLYLAWTSASARGGGGRHRKGDPVPRSYVFQRARRRAAEVPLDGSASRLARPYLPREIYVSPEVAVA
ncbi:hypothetical protein QF026_005028 [Streptomyces aurantiacus]|uniref:hypothetical protein n=1 Tax=Streptomyces aurantiacus TaxID=47760 RepID=UPI00278FA04D|nr:hypothetical protein [Streptomyces aurantiacus]MDQ0776562.1 hypothetical protein [Streptomyces aurantiacus]